MPDLNQSSVTEEDVVTLGQASMRWLAEALQGCVTAGCATSTDVSADAVALWLSLHGLAHQRAAAPSFPWPPDIAERVITTLAHFTDEQGVATTPTPAGRMPQALARAFPLAARWLPVAGWYGGDIVREALAALLRLRSRARGSASASPRI